MPIITKLEAAGTLLDSAIEHFLRGDYITAVHCAGAAEELCSRYLEGFGNEMFLDKMQRELGDLRAKREYVGYANRYKDWLKHSKRGLNETATYEDINSRFYLDRAVIAYGAVRDHGDAPQRASLNAYEAWHHANAERLAALLEEIANTPDHLLPTGK